MKYKINLCNSFIHVAMLVAALAKTHGFFLLLQVVPDKCVLAKTLMDPICTVRSVLQIASDLAQAHSRVKGNRNSCAFLAQRCENLAKQIRPLLSGSQPIDVSLAVLLDQLNSVLDDCLKYISKFEHAHYIYKLGFRDRDDAAFTELSTKLDKIAGVRSLTRLFIVRMSRSVSLFCCF